MPDFFRVDPASPDTFIRGAARLLWAGTTIAFPSKLGDVINLSSYDAMTGWNDLGATKSGIQISVNNTEETFDVDQVYGDIDSRPTSWDVQIGTQLAEMTLANMAFAWEGSPVTLDTSMVPNERVMGLGTPQVYTQRRLAVMFLKSNNKVRGFFIRKVNRTPQDSSITFNKTGEQISIPARFKALPDTSVVDTLKRFLEIRDQV